MINTVTLSKINRRTNKKQMNERKREMEKDKRCKLQTTLMLQAFKSEDDKGTIWRRKKMESKGEKKRKGKGRNIE